MKKSYLLVGLGAAAALLAGCSNEPDKYDVKEYTSIANPASVYCVQQDGKLETVTENDQRVTYCVFSENDRTEQWEYYREHQKKADNTSMQDAQ
ncbi:MULTISPECIES: putative hemolysin [Vibrio]|uniref:Hemolysin n=1 Tax=Vibrio proteolyticus NBRC 13287 TaxID=1219065 RepID=U3A078_VIBPR|nr:MULTISPECIES: DUF333 domain-containing protein [Vibrio]NAW58791.1 DUF333 domain-containing protein [Vibrio sp. V36_P2S2PM302]NAX19695.1 DUF333 domain-containing protein [Vibrio sp. V39_P1S14PM300]NAX25420.1 DUF333 domain-containing protein [Vibrio sp. V38_P2S17PM301]NAX32173.1 DUF333 domain-containing protein [Vibrio sp. V37_P2S8PM304]GAD67090.1 hypothetical protein VPR01S_06_01070 [Vibrio proteolyticus NBRC 13287]